MNQFLVLAVVLCHTVSSAPAPTPNGLQFLAALAPPPSEPGIERKPEDAVFHSVETVQDVMADFVPPTQRNKRLNKAGEESLRAFGILSRIFGLVGNDDSVTLLRFAFGTPAPPRKARDTSLVDPQSVNGRFTSQINGLEDSRPLKPFTEPILASD